MTGAHSEIRRVAAAPGEALQCLGLPIEARIEPLTRWWFRGFTGFLPFLWLFVVTVSI